MELRDDRQSHCQGEHLWTKREMDGIGMSRTILNSDSFSTSTRGNHIIFHILRIRIGSSFNFLCFPQQMQNGMSLSHKTQEKPCECHFSTIFNLLWIHHIPLLSPSLLICQTPRLGHPTRFRCSSEGGQGH